MAHFNVLARLLHTETMTSQAKAVFIMLVYDELVRRSWAQRVQQGDPGLNTMEKLEETSTVLDKHMLEIAKIRVA